MATLVKIRGLDRSAGKSVGTAAGQDFLNRGFRIPLGIGQQFPDGTKATLSKGAGTAKVIVTAKSGGTWANGAGALPGLSLKLTAANPEAGVTTTQAASTGKVLVDVSLGAGSTATAAEVVDAINNDSAASQFLVASLDSSGAGTVVAAAAADLAGGTDVGTGQPINVTVTNKVTAIVNLEDGAVARLLRRNIGRFVSLGQP